ncbi:MAG: hypothetical protein M3Y71_11550, partial [Actinomycetota bacterium]|nr:hypothetical protein [Actinomycetota bacterium]
AGVVGSALPVVAAATPTPAAEAAWSGEPMEPREPVGLQAVEPVVYDLMAVDAAARAAVAAAVFAQEWSPVPVPTPTYMLKDSAPRQSAEWGGWDESTQPATLSMVPVPIEVEDDELEQLMAARHRRVVG